MLILLKDQGYCPKIKDGSTLEDPITEISVIYGVR